MRSALDQQFIDEPVNVGSGKGVAITELVQRILGATQSQSSVEFLRARESEVVAFVADIQRAQKYFNVVSPEDPLAHLIEVVAWVRASAPAGDAAVRWSALVEVCSVVPGEPGIVQNTPRSANVRKTAGGPTLRNDPLQTSRSPERGRCNSSWKRAPNTSVAISSFGPHAPTFHITGSKKQSDEGAALFAVRVNVMVMLL